MNGVDDNLYLSQLSIPGSHDSCATKGVKIPVINKDYGKCQNYTIFEQLNLGTRFLDIRCKCNDDAKSLAIHHGNIYQNLMFGDVLNQCQEFLNNHPKEFILMRVKQEYSSVSDEIFKQAFLSYVAKYPDLFWNNQQQNMKDPQVKDLRGKIVVLYNLNGLNFGLDYSHFFSIQDEYETSNVDEKWQNIKNYLNEANKWGNFSKPIINYSSAQGNVSNTPEDISKKINPLLVSELDNSSYKHLGIIAFDFITEEINKKIISKNFSNYIRFLGLGDTLFAQTFLKNNQLTIQYNSESGPHVYYDNTYAAVYVYDNFFHRYVFKGNQSYGYTEDVINLNENDLVALYHAEGNTRLIDGTNNKNKIRYYRFKNGKLIPEETNYIYVSDVYLKQKINQALNNEEINGRAGRNDDDAIIEQEISHLTALNVNNSKVTNLEGIKSATNLLRFMGCGNDFSKVNLEYFNFFQKLKVLELKSGNISQEQFSKLQLNQTLTDLNLDNNHIYDLSNLQVVPNNFSIMKQTIEEKESIVKNGNLTLKIKPIKNVDGSVPVIKPDNGGRVDAATNTITWTNLNTSCTKVTYTWEGNNNFTGTVTVPVKIDKSKIIVHDSTIRINSEWKAEDNFDSALDENGESLSYDKLTVIGKVNTSKIGTYPVTYTYKNTTKTIHITVIDPEPSWYIVLPALVSFTDDTKIVDASVKIVNEDDQQTAYTGSKTVKVKVKSGNGFELKDGEKTAVEYSLTKHDGSAVTKDQTEQELGTLSKDTATINSKAKLIGTAKETGTYVDTLTYHFSEQ